MKKSLLAFIAVFVVVTLVIGFFPRSPKSAEKTTEISKVDLEINQAVDMVQTGAPMEGIMKLRALLEEYPDNARIHYELGHFSITSGQITKAIERFEKVISIAPNEFPEAYFFLGKLQVETGNTENGTQNLKKYQSLATDSVIIAGIDNMLKEISINQ